MSRADELRAQHAAEQAVAELEEALTAAKESGDVPRELKENLREARRVWRELRSDGTANPDVIETSAEVA